MIKNNDRFFTALGLLFFFLLCLVPAGQAQQGTPLSYAAAPAQLALSWNFTASSPATGGFTVNGLRYWQVLFIPTGTVSTCSLSLDSSAAGNGSFSTGGIISAGTIGSCASAGSYSNSSGTTPTLQGQLTPTITGTGSVEVVLLGYVNNPAAAGGGSSSITSPVDGSGYVEVNCKTGCSGGNANGQATMANSAPVVIASNQSTLATQDAASSATGSAVPAKGIYVAGSNSGTEVGLKVDSLGDLDMNLESAIPAGSNVIGGVTTQPTGFAASPLGNQVAVTATAANLGSNSVHGVCITALISNTIPVYVGGSGVTTSTGWPMNAGDFYCWQVNNTNLLYVIASTTGASVAWSAN
jgi:hypothetical protein